MNYLSHKTGTTCNHNWSASIELRYRCVCLRIEIHIHVLILIHLWWGCHFEWNFKFARSFDIIILNAQNLYRCLFGFGFCVRLWTGCNDLYKCNSTGRICATQAENNAVIDAIQNFFFVVVVDSERRKRTISRNYFFYIRIIYNLCVCAFLFCCQNYGEHMIEKRRKQGPRRMGSIHKWKTKWKARLNCLSSLEWFLYVWVYICKYSVSFSLCYPFNTIYFMFYLNFLSSA